MIYENDQILIKLNEHKNPWIIIFAKDKNLKEFSDLDEKLRNFILKCVLICEKTMIDYFKPIKINHAIFGNEVPIFHYHLQARFIKDEYYPNPLWGKKLRQWDEEIKKDEFKKILANKLKNLTL